MKKANQGDGLLMDDGIKGTDGGSPIYAGGGGGGVPSGNTVVAFGGGGGAYTIRQAPTNLSFIEDHEEAEAQRLIDDEFRSLTKCEEFPEGVTFREHARLTRYFAAVKIFVRPEELKTFTDATTGQTRTLYLPDTVRAEDKYQSCCGTVIALGPEAFTNKDGTPRGSRWRVADWVVFPRSDIIRIDFHGIPIGIMTDDRAIVVTDDPRHWTPGSFKYKV